MDHLGVEAISAISGDTSGLSLVWLAGILALVLTIALVSSRIMRTRTIEVRHLFLKIKIDFKNRTQMGFIRSLDVDRALIVTPFLPEKKDFLTLDLSSLPEFPKSDVSTVQAKVRRVRPIGGQPRNFLVEVRFGNSASPNKPYLSPLISYLRQLHRTPA